MAPAAEGSRLRLMALLGHDLRAPLATILGHAAQLRGVVPPTHAAYLRAIERSTAHQLELVDELMGVAVAAPRDAPSRAMPVDFEDFAAGIAQDAAALALALPQRNAFSLVRAPTLPRWLVLDAQGLRQVLLNLLANAMACTHEGRVELQVDSHEDTAAPGADDTAVVRRVAFRVIDGGPGFTAAQRRRVFGPASTPRSSPRSSPRPSPLGHGLGLFAAQRIVARMGGVLTLAGTGPGGSVLAFSLPLCTPPAAGPARLRGYRLPRHERASIDRLAADGQWSELGQLLDGLAARGPRMKRALSPLREAFDALDFDAVRRLVNVDIAY